MDGGAGLALGQEGVAGADHFDPQLHVLPLEPAHSLAVGVPEAVQLTVVQGDQGAVVEGEVDVALDERVQQRLRGAVAGGRVLGDPQLSAGQEALADADQEFGEHRVLAGEVAVEAGSADPHGSAYFVDAHAVEAALGEEAGSLLEDLLTACRGVRPGGHGFDSRQSG